MSEYTREVTTVDVDDYVFIDTRPRVGKQTVEVFEFFDSDDEEIVECERTVFDSVKPGESLETKWKRAPKNKDDVVFVDVYETDTGKDICVWDKRNGSELAFSENENKVPKKEFSWTVKLPTFPERETFKEMKENVMAAGIETGLATIRNGLVVADAISDWWFGRRDV